MKNPYEILEVNADATDEEIKKAYRKKAQESHPDKGGDTELFQEISKAYSILSNAEKRDHFDATGEEKQNNIEGEVIGSLVQIVMSTIQNYDPKYNNLITIAQGMVEQQQARHIASKDAFTNQLERLKDASSRISVTEGKENLLSSAILSHIKDVEAQIAEIEKVILIGERILVMIKDYSYKNESAPQWGSRFQTSRWASTTTGV